MSENPPRIAYFREFRREIWAELRRNIDDDEGWNGQPIQAHHGPFGIVLDVHAEAAGYSSLVLTRIRAAFINRDGFRFRIKRRTWMSSLSTILGAQDIEVGEAEFDKQFVLQANSTGELKRLLKEQAIRGQLLSLPVNLVEVRDDEGMFGPPFPGEVDELYMASEGRITKLDQIEGLYELFADILDRMCRIGSAYMDDPNVSL